MSTHKHQWVEESARGSTYVVCATCYLLPDGLLTIRERDEARAEVRRLRRGVRDRDDLIRAAAEALREEGYMGKERAKWLEEQAARLTNTKPKRKSAKKRTP